MKWAVAEENRWSGNGIDGAIKEGKQAEFPVEESFPWNFVERIGVQSLTVYHQVSSLLGRSEHRPKVEILKDWYY